MKAFGCFVFLSICQLSLCANIMLFGGPPSPSHHIFNRVLAFGLAEKGHNVTYVGCDQEKEKHKNLHFILLEGAYEAIEEFELTELANVGKFESIGIMYSWAHMFCKSHFKSAGLKKLMDYPKEFKFDLIIMDITIGQCLYPIIDKFNNPPVVGLTAFLLPNYLASVFGAYVFPSYYPHYSLQVTNEMTFTERMWSTLLVLYEDYYRSNIYAKGQYEIAKEYFGEKTRKIHEYENEFKILLSNTNPFLDYAVMLPPNIIPVGGMQIKTPKPLPNDLANIADNAKHGFIFFSLGTNLQSKALSATAKSELLKAFGRFKQVVFWKYEADDLQNIPDNVKIQKWFPQNDVLGHKNCKLFITHAGGLSTQEAIYHGTPMVAIPGFADQHKNAHMVVTKGFGLKLDIMNLKENDIYNAVNTVLNDVKYKKAVQALSEKYKDRPQTALDSAVFWSEFVLRHKNIEEMNLPSRKLHFLQTYCLDVFAVVIGGPCLLLFITVKMLKKVFCKNKTVTEKIKKQ